ncbi:hypothetical protein TWF694_011687 [Orbilia ellipsospora]|uniref:Phosphatidate phosphatase APP1 catalytic domain-containing protein n=1 Tax=Orbilia ellipsospora TaxID=2528407 RepID=A0AAV9X8W4_9PEZI
MYSDNILRAAALAALASSTLANPVRIPQADVEIVPRGAPLITDDVLLFDAPAFQSGNGSDLTASVRIFAHFRSIDTKAITGPLTSGLEALGIEIGNGANNLMERTKLFFTISRKDISVDLNISGCNSINVGNTAKTGLLEQSRNIGNCGRSLTSRDITGSAPGLFTRRAFNGTLFPSGPTGFGVISDIDDTIKISMVLDKKAALQKLLIDDHKPVDGMPKLYTKMNTVLTNPAWFYVSGSPYQFYPSLRPFIFSNFPHGPMIMQNLTVTDVAGLVKMISDNDTVKNFKIEQIEKIYGFYPKKKFLTVGDSGQADPEVYGEIFRRHPQFIQCIWIREVEGGNNTDARFAAAFKGVPQSQWKVFSDPSELMGLDVANGKCK